MQRPGYAQSRSTLGAIFRLNAATMRAHHGFDKGKTESVAFRTLSLPSLFEHLAIDLKIKSGAVVFNGEDGCVFGGAERNPNGVGSA
jgi:hypothetical protein